MSYISNAKLEQFDPPAEQEFEPSTMPSCPVLSKRGGRRQETKKLCAAAKNSERCMVPFEHASMDEHKQEIRMGQ